MKKGTIQQCVEIMRKYYRHINVYDLSDSYGQQVVPRMASLTNKTDRYVVPTGLCGHTASETMEGHKGICSRPAFPVKPLPEGFWNDMKGVSEKC